MTRPTQLTELTELTEFGTVFEELLWPTQVEVIHHHQEMGGAMVVWRQDRQSYAAMIEGIGLGWIGDQHGQHPTMEALRSGLNSLGFVVHEPDEQYLDDLETRVSTEIGRAWLVGNQCHGRAVLAVVHPDESVTRLEPEWVWPKPGDGTGEPSLTPFSFGPDSTGLVAAAAAATNASGGDYMTPTHWDWDWSRSQWGTKDVIARGFGDLPARFAIDLADMGVWGTDTSPLVIATHGRQVEVLEGDIAVRGVDPSAVESSVYDRDLMAWIPHNASPSATKRTPHDPGLVVRVLTRNPPTPASPGPEALGLSR